MIERPAASAALRAPVAAVTLAAAIALTPGAGRAAETVDGPAGDPEEPRPAAEGAAEAPAVAEVFDHLLVTGGGERVERVPGSASYLGTAELERQRHSDLHRILQGVPGLHLQEEDGYGLRPNIGMRGTGVERSQKITLMEDGVLIAPAPYAAPAAYYVPTAGRMAAVEVRKGSSSIRHGPFTNGGVINLVSSPIPGRLAAQVELAFGEDATRRLHASSGGTGERLGWLVETFHLRSDGFKRLDGGGPTGFDLEDYLGKLRFASRPRARVYQALELKLGLTDQFGEETYLGLTEPDFARTPLRRYAASREDWIDSQHSQVQLRWLVQPLPRAHLTATLYRNEFDRNWHKLQSVSGVGIAAVLDSPERYASELALLRGERDDATGALAIRNNRRGYASEGAELVAGWSLETGGVGHAFEAGVRLHRDEEDRFQEEDRWNLVDGAMDLFAVGAPGSQSNRVSEASAVAWFLRDEIAFSRFSLSPGLRVERIRFARRDFGGDDPRRLGADLAERRNEVSVALPGLGAAVELGPAWSLFGGVHRGFAPPGPGSREETEAETSWNWEAGANYRGRNLGARLVGFYNDYDNLLGRDTLATGGEGTGELFNGGEVVVRGVEAILDWDPGRARGLGLSLPVRLSYSATEAEFRSSFETPFADWAPRVERGDEVPYVPEQQLWLSLAALGERWSADLTATWSGRMRTRAGQGRAADGTAIDEHLVLDLAASRRLGHGVEIFARVRNLLDESYAAARRPAGLRPGLPRTALAGVRWELDR